MRAFAVLALGAGLMTMPSASAEQTPDPDFPNLPLRSTTEVYPGVPSLGTAPVTNLAYVGPSKQWVRLADVKVTADVTNLSLPFQEPQCRQIFGQESRRCDTIPGLANQFVINARAYPNNFVGDDPSSPPAARDDLRRFGAEFTSFPAQRVRLAAFGAVPAEATIHLDLATDANGLPIGLQLDAADYQLSRGRPRVADTVGSGDLSVRLSDVMVDGVEVAVGDSCRAEAPIALRGRGYTGSNTVPEGSYNPALGGYLQGTISVGSFQECGSSDDIGPLINAMAGDTDLSVGITQATVGALCFSDNLRLPVEQIECATLGDIEFPDGEGLPPFVPGPLPPPPID